MVSVHAYVMNAAPIRGRRPHQFMDKSEGSLKCRGQCLGLHACHVDFHYRSRDEDCRFECPGSFCQDKTGTSLEMDVNRDCHCMTCGLVRVSGTAWACACAHAAL